MNFDSLQKCAIWSCIFFSFFAFSASKYSLVKEHVRLCSQYGRLVNLRDSGTENNRFFSSIDNSNAFRLPESYFRALMTCFNPWSRKKVSSICYFVQTRRILRESIKLTSSNISGELGNCFLILHVSLWGILFEKNAPMILQLIGNSEGICVTKVLNFSTNVSWGVS